MEKRLLSENFSCEELGNELIEEFKSMKCEELETFAILNFRKLDEEIPESEKLTQVAAADKEFNFKTKSFEVHNFQDVFEKNILKYTCLSLYFTCEDIDGNNLNIAFKFSEKDQWEEGFPKDNDMALYELKKGILTLVSNEADFKRIEKNVGVFEEFFLKNYDEKSFTKYITFHLEKIKRNFRSFASDCIIWVGAREPYKRITLKPNLILDIDRNCVRNPAHKNSTARQYFNMGHLYP